MYSRTVEDRICIQEVSSTDYVFKNCGGLNMYSRTEEDRICIQELWRTEYVFKK